MVLKSADKAKLAKKQKISLESPVRYTLPSYFILSEANAFTIDRKIFPQSEDSRLISYLF